MLWAEAWTLPELGSFEVLHGTVPGVVTVNDPASGMGRGSITVPADWPHLTDLLSSTGSTLIRVCRRDASAARQIVAEFCPETSLGPYGPKQQKTMVLAGKTIEMKLDHAAVLPFDFPTNPSVDPNWQWGFTDLLGTTNGGFEDNPFSIVNPGAEDGTTDGWPTTGTRYEAIAPETFEAIESGAAADTGDWYFSITADAGEGIYQDFNQPLVEGKDYTVTARLYVATGDTTRMEVTDATAVSVGSLFNGAAYADAVGNDAYQTVTVTFTAGDGTPGSGISILSQTAANTFRLDTVTVSGYGAGTEDWNIRGDVDVFSLQTATVHGGTYALQWHPDSGVLGADSIYLPVSTAVGTEVTASVWVYHTEGSNKDIRIVIRIPGVNPNTQNVDSQQYSVPTATWTKLTASGVTTTSMVEIEVRWDETGAPSNNLLVDDAEFYTGQAPTSIGDIVNQLHVDVSTSHTAEGADFDIEQLTWLKTDFTSTLDSNGDAWDTSDLSMTIPAFLSFGQVMDRAARLGYEWRIIPNTDFPAVDTESHVLQIFNPWDNTAYTGGTGTDNTATVTVTSGQAITSGPVKRTELTRNVAFSMDTEGNISVARDATGETNWGERVIGVRETHITGDSTQPVADQIISDRAQTVTASKIRLIETDYLPYVHMSPGDTITVGLPPDLPEGSRRIAALDYTVTEGDVEWGLHFDRPVYVGMSGTVQAVDRLLRKSADPEYAQPDITVTPGDDLARPPDDTYTVAASNSRPEMYAQADYKCSGANDEIEIHAALAAAFAIAPGGRVLLFAGKYIVEDDLLLNKARVTVEGMGPSTELEIDESYDIILSATKGQLLKVRVTEGGGGG